MKKNKRNPLRIGKNLPNLDISTGKLPLRLYMALHNDYEIRWQTFKGFKDTEWLTIKPITIIIGPNNSGKSGLIAPLLLMNQTVTSTDPLTPLVLSGKTYDGGNIRELLHNYDLKNKQITFGFKYHVHKPPKNIKKVGSYMPGAFDVTIEINNSTDRELSVVSQTIYDIYSRPYLSIIRNTEGLYKAELFTDSKSKLNPSEVQAIANCKPVNFLFAPNSLISRLHNPKQADGNEKNNETYKRKPFSTAFIEILDILSANISLVRDIVGDISYVGPIRDNPHRHYELKRVNYASVGSSGENVAELLNKHLPTIQKDLNKWIKKFEFGDSLFFKKLSNNLRQIRFKNNSQKTYTNIANAGFGASQLIPLIVQALVSGRNCLTICEQPEIHLNPRLQATLAELFVLMADKDQRVIIETHSEHMLLRLRRLVAEGKIKKEKIAIYFVEKTNNITNIRLINMDDNGAISSSEWPRGFFGDTLKESLALASQQAKNRIKKSN